jgi:uncharacterized protein YndB with AHSA1/START domain
MTMADSNLDLTISRYLAVPRARIWRAWTDPKLLAQWWCPKPWTTEVRAFDMRPGGDFYTFMRGPEGGESDNPGCFVEIVPMEKIAFTTMLVGGWRPASPWMPMTGVFTMADEGEGTRYTATAMHRDAADAKNHEDMGFYDGWGTCVTQIEEFAKTL